MLNHAVIMGRITRDLELRSTANGHSVTSFTVAVDRDYTPSGEEKQTDFIDVVAWRHTAEFVTKYFRKGSMIVVSGRLQYRRWDDKDGNKRSSTEIVADNCYFGERKSDGPQGQSYNSNADYGTPPPERSAPRAAINAPSQPSYEYQDSGSFSELDDDGEVPF